MMGWCPYDGEECHHDGYCEDCEHNKCRECQEFNCDWCKYKRLRGEQHEHTMEEFMYGQNMGYPEDGSL